MKTSLFSDALSNALCCRNQGRPPIWLMRQAGRYMPEYRALRKKYDFLHLCHDPELIAKVTQLPVDIFGMDAAILFSDILLIPEAFGVGLKFEEGSGSSGPVIERPLSNPEDIAALPQIQIKESLSYMSEAIKLLKQQLDVPLIGFAGAPFTLASYMIEGGTSRTFRKTKKWMLADPASFHQLLDLLAEQVVGSLKLQIEAGVDAVQLFDSWAGTLAYHEFCTFSKAYLQKIVSRVAGSVPVILFCKGASSYAADLASIKPNGISVDWNADLPALRRMLPAGIALQGNLDPEVLHAPPQVVRSQALRLLDAMRDDPGYIFNLGHGITPETPVDSVKILVDTVKEYK